jgi:dephospho-CoA kinase
VKTAGYGSAPILQAKKPRSIVIVGRPGSGKDVCASYFKELLPGTKIINLGDIVRGYSLLKYGRVDRGSLQKASINIRELFGEDIVASLAIHSAGESKTKTKPKWVLFNGLRDVAELRRIQEEFNTVVVAIDVPAVERYTRLARRDRKDDSRDVRRLIIRDADEDKWSKIDRLIEIADVTIENGGSLAQFKARIRDLAKTLETSFRTPI